MDIAQEMLTMFNDDPNLLKKIITADESYHGYDIKTKGQSSQWIGVQKSQNRKKLFKFGQM